MLARTATLTGSLRCLVLSTLLRKTAPHTPMRVVPMHTTESQQATTARGGVHRTLKSLTHLHPRLRHFIASSQARRLRRLDSYLSWTILLLRRHLGLLPLTFHHTPTPPQHSRRMMKTKKTLDLETLSLSANRRTMTPRKRPSRRVLRLPKLQILLQLDPVSSPFHI